MPFNVFGQVQASEMASKALQSEELGEEEMQPAPKLLEVILQNCRGRVDECLPLYLQASPCNKPIESLLFVSATLLHHPLCCTSPCAQLAMLNSCVCELAVLQSVVQPDFNACCASTCLESIYNFESPQGMPHHVKWCLHAAHSMMLMQLPTVSFHALLALGIVFAGCQPRLMCWTQTMHEVKILCPVMPIPACCSAAHVQHTCCICSLME